MNTKIVGILIIVLGLAGLSVGGYFFYKQMFYVPDEQIPELSQETQTEKQASQKVKEEPKNSFTLPIETENGSVEKIMDLGKKKSVVISGAEADNTENESITEERLKRTASLFVERFGSYSNQSNFSNVSDLKIYMSADMKKWADNFIADNNVDRDVSNYYGITTKSISQNIISFSEGSGLAAVEVNTLRRESGGDLSEDNSFYQKASVSFVRENGFWKVNKTTWQ